MNCSVYPGQSFIWSYEIFKLRDVFQNEYKRDDSYQFPFFRLTDNFNGKVIEFDGFEHTFDPYVSRNRILAFR